RHRARERARAQERVDQPARRERDTDGDPYAGASGPGRAARDARPARRRTSLSALRAKCPDCRTLTAVAIGPEYQCHSCGREFAAGLIRVPRAWGDGGDAMADAAGMALPWPEAATVSEDTLEAQIEATARELPA